MSETFQTVSLLKLLDIEGEELLNRRLFSFSCPLNPDIEIFLKEKAIDFARRRWSITYLVMNRERRIAGYFALAHKNIVIQNDAVLSSSDRRILRSFSQNREAGPCSVSAFLLAQFGRNFAEDTYGIDGTTLMDTVMTVLTDIRDRIGGKIVYLDCEKSEKLRAFYERNRYKYFGERTTPDASYLQMIRFF